MLQHSNCELVQLLFGWLVFVGVTLALYPATELRSINLIGTDGGSYLSGECSQMNLKFSS